MEGNTAIELISIGDNRTVETQDQNGRNRNIFTRFWRKFRITTQYKTRRKDDENPPQTENELCSLSKDENPELPNAAASVNTTQKRDSETGSTFESTSSVNVIKNNPFAKYNNSTWYVTENKLGRLNTLLFLAVENNNTADIKRLIFGGASPNATCRYANITACHAAAYNNSEALFVLLKNKVISNRTDKFGRTPLHFASWAGNSWNVAMLLDIPKDEHNEFILPIMHESEKVRFLQMRLKYVIDVPCKIPEPDTNMSVPTSWLDGNGHKCRKYMTNIPMFYEGWTALHIASFAAHPTTTRLLLAAGANPNSKDASGRTPLDIAGGKIHGINKNSYVETIKTLIEYGGKLNSEIASHGFDTALHTAVELCSVDAIKILLDENAPITCYNNRGNTPLHECVLKCYEEPLKILANHQWSFEMHSSADVRDSSGSTVLHTAINTSWLPGVLILLAAGADVACGDYNRFTSIHLAALKGNPDILNETINAAKSVNSVIHKSKKVESPLLCAIRSGNLDCVQTIIDEGAPTKVTTYCDPGFDDVNSVFEFSFDSVNECSDSNLILHAAAEASNEDILKFLLDYSNDINELLEYKCPYLMNTTPVEFAAFHNRHENFIFLLHRTVAKAKASGKEFDPSALLDIVATLDLEKLFIEIIKIVPTAVNIARERGHYPLHKAIKHSKTNNMILQLIKNGADLSQRDISGYTAIDLIFEHRTDPTECILSILDCYIQTNNYPVHDPVCEITVDYSVLIPTLNSSKGGQMKVLTSVLKISNDADKIKLLEHPLVQSFLYLKWRTLSRYFYTFVFIYSLFVMLFFTYISSVYYFKDEGPFPDYFCSFIWQVFILMSLYFIVVQEISCANLAAPYWIFKIFKLCVKFATYSLAMMTTILISQDSPDTEWRRHLASITLVFSWLNIMLLLSRTPISICYVHQFYKVSFEFVKIALLILVLTVTFSICFMIQFYTRYPFDGPWPAFVQTLSMFELDMDYEEENAIAILILSVTYEIILSTYFSALVYYVKEIVFTGDSRGLEQQVEFLHNLEKPCRLESSLQALGIYGWFEYKKVQQTVIVKPGLKRKLYYPRSITEEIINIAHNQFEKIEQKPTLINDNEFVETPHIVVMK